MPDHQHAPDHGRPGLVLRGATLADGSVADVEVGPDRVHAVRPPGPPSQPPPAGAQVHDLAGYVLLPAPAEPHAHLDKALLAHRLPNPGGDLAGAIEAMVLGGHEITGPDLLDRGRRAALLQLGYGATAIRSHADVGGRIGLRHLTALVQLRDELAPMLTLQVTALVASPTTGPAGRLNADLLRAALDAGADLVGGVPHLDPDPAAATQLALNLAAEYGRPVDLHTDETLDPAADGLELLARLVLRTGFPLPVTASHCCSLGMQPPDRQRRVAELVAQAGISVVTLPQTNLYLQGRGRPDGTPRGLTAVRALLDAGATLAAGGDNVRDPFNAMGRGDPLEAASLLVTAGHLTAAEAYRAIGRAARTALGLDPGPADAVLRPGAPAELLAVRGVSLADA